MAKKILITGEQGTGKSTEARKAVNGRKTAWITSLTQLKDRIDVDTEVIVVESDNNISLDKLKAFITSANISFRKPYAANVTKINMPELIIVDNRLKDDANLFDETISCH